MATSEDDRRDIFQKIGMAKGMPVRFDQKDVTLTNSGVFHLDLNVVDAVINDAILAVENLLDSKGGRNPRTLLKIRKRLHGLLESGSDYEKITFAFSRGRYIFPEDVALMALSAKDHPNRMSRPMAISCETICNIVCNCICDGHDNCEQFCENVCHDICTGDDDDSEP